MTVLDSGVGHGRLGIRSGMSLFDELVGLPVYDKRTIVEARPAVLVEDWTFVGSGSYQTAFDQPFDDVRLDVVAVETTDEILVREDSLGRCLASPGTFFYEILEVPPPTIPLWDDGVTQWDDGVTRWDPTSFLTVHLSDGSNPSGTKVMAMVGLYFANKGMVEPSLGDEKLTNGGFEDGFTDWTIAAGGNANLDIVGADAIVESGSARWTLFSTTSNFKAITRRISLVAGAMYRISGLYLVIPTGDPTTQIRVDVLDPSLTDYVQENGRDMLPTPGATELLDTGGSTRRFIFDFVASETGDFLLQLRGAAANTAGGFAFWDDGSSAWDSSTRWDDFGAGFPSAMADDVSLRRIWRFNYHEPRISGTAVPEVQTGSRDIFFTAQQIGTGAISFVNGDGYFEELMARFNWESHDMFIRVGGAFRDGEELLVDDYRTRFRAIMRRDSVTDEKADLALEDVRSFILQTLPPRTYTSSDFEGLDPSLDGKGKARPMWFGPKSDITPVRIDLTPNGYGVYELADPEDMPNGITSVDEVYSYIDSEAAGNLDSARRRLLVEGSDYAVDLIAAQVEILRDIQLIEVVADQNSIDWSQTAAATPILSGFVIPGTYLPHELANAIVTVLNAQAGSSKSAFYDQTTHTFSFSRSFGFFNLHIGDGPNKDGSIWSTVGFTEKDNLTGATSYTGDTAVYATPEEDHILRMGGVGYRDSTPENTFTGVSGAPIQIGADIVRVLWELFMGQDPALIDEPSFLGARISAPYALGAYIRSNQDIKSIFQRIQDSDRANIVIDGTGRIRFIVNVPGAEPAGTPGMTDSDYIEWAMRKELDNVYGVVRILYDEDPTLGDTQVREVVDPDTETLFSRKGAKEFLTYLTDPSDAGTVATATLNLASSPQRLAEFRVKGLVELVEGEKVRLTRERGIDVTESLDDELFRVLLVRNAPLSASTQILAVEDI